MDHIEKLAKILRTDKSFLEKAERRLSLISGKNGIFKNIADNNDAKMADRLSALGLSFSADAHSIYNALISKIDADDKKISEALNFPKSGDCEDCSHLLKRALDVAGNPKGFFIKEEKAREFLRNEPPKEIMKFLGYDSVDEMLCREDLFEIMSALRFIESAEWLNGVFFKQYESLSPDDFEEREVRALAIPSKWNGVAEKFVKKKWHNISHLKEMGVIFIIPVSLGISGELLRMISLIFHYIHEVPFYSDIFREIAKVPATFSSNFVSLLRGDVPEMHTQNGEKSVWLVVQRYLAKDDENDPRLFVPRVNPEALHWMRAEKDLIAFGNSIDGLGDDLEFWADLDWVGGYFSSNKEKDALVSFNLVDTVMSLVKQKELIKYLYHHGEALWNKIFMEYFSEEELERYMKDYLLKGYFEM